MHTGEETRFIQNQPTCATNCCTVVMIKVHNTMALSAPFTSPPVTPTFPTSFRDGFEYFHKKHPSEIENLHWNIGSCPVISAYLILQMTRRSPSHTWLFVHADEAMWVKTNILKDIGSTKNNPKMVNFYQEASGDGSECIEQKPRWWPSHVTYTCQNTT